MSHRRPLTKADKVMNDELRMHPELMRLREGMVDTTSDEMYSLCPSFGRIAMNMTRENLLRYDNDQTMLRPAMVALWSRWRYCRHVYRFDGTLSDELSSMSVPDDMPVASLSMLPYPVIYVESRIPYRTVRGTELEVNGFFAWMEGDQMAVLFIVEGRTNGVAMTLFDLTKSTLGEVVTRMTEGDKAYCGVIGITPSDDYVDSMRTTIASVVNHLLYVISDNCEQEVTYRPSGNTKRSSKSSPSTIHEVGTRVGRRLGQARVRYLGKRSETTGRKVRAHVRAAHWHHFWTGPRDGERKLVVRWLEPMFVGVGETDTVIHES